jgi:hypothetical protein
VPHTPHGSSCGSPQARDPAVIYPAHGSPLNAYSRGSPDDVAAHRAAQAGISGNFGGSQGASGDLQLTLDASSGTPGGNITTGGNSRGGGGTVAVGNDGNETDDPYTPSGSPVAVCQD